MGAGGRENEHGGQALRGKVVRGAGGTGEVSGGLGGQAGGGRHQGAQVPEEASGQGVWQTQVGERGNKWEGAGGRH